MERRTFIKCGSPKTASKKGLTTLPSTISLLTSVSAAFALVSCAAEPSPLPRMKGRHARSYISGDVFGATYRVTDVVEIQQTSPNTANVSLEINFFNGHTCSISGPATLEGHKLVHRDPELQGWDGAQCRLEIWIDGDALRWTDGDNSCRDACGMRGSLIEGEIPLRGSSGSTDR